MSLYGYVATGASYVGAAVSYIPGVSYLTGYGRSQPVNNQSDIEEAVKGVFLSAAGNNEEITPAFVAEQMDISSEIVDRIYALVQPEVQAVRERALVLSFYHVYIAGDKSAASIAADTGLSRDRVVEIFGSI